MDSTTSKKKEKHAMGLGGTNDFCHKRRRRSSSLDAARAASLAMPKDSRSSVSEGGDSRGPGPRRTRSLSTGHVSSQADSGGLHLRLASACAIPGDKIE
jgi:hypothetical protein